MRHHKDIVTLFSSDDQSFSYSKLLGWDLCLNQQYHVKNQSNQNQITFIVTSPQYMSLGEWNSWERAPDSTETIYI